MRRAGWDTLVETLKPFVTLPNQLQRVLSAVERGELQLETTPDAATQQRLRRMERKMTQLQVSVLAAAGLISGTLLYLGRYLNNRHDE